MKTYSATDVKLITEWIGRYFEVISLVNRVFNTQYFENTPQFFSFDDEIEYQRLRFWFCKNHDEFVPIWADFCNSTDELTEFVGNFDGMDYSENPFLFFYYPDNLLELAYSIGAIVAINNWDLDKENAELILNVNNRFSHTVLHLKHWIGEFAEISG